MFLLPGGGVLLCSLRAEALFCDGSRLDFDLCIMGIPLGSRLDLDLCIMGIPLGLLDL